MSNPSIQARNIQARNIQTGDLLWQYRVPDNYFLQRVAPNGRSVVFVVLGRNTIYYCVLDTTNERTLTATSIVQRSYSVSLDEKTVIVVPDYMSKKSMIQIRRITDGQLLSTITPPACYITGIDFSPNEKQFLIKGWNNLRNEFWVYDIKARTLAWSFKTTITDETARFDSPIWSPDGKKLAIVYCTSNSNEKILIISAQGKERGHLERTLIAGKIRPLAFSPDNKKLYGIDEGIISVWDLN